MSLLINFIRNICCVLKTTNMATGRNVQIMAYNSDVKDVYKVLVAIIQKKITKYIQTTYISDIGACRPMMGTKYFKTGTKSSFEMLCILNECSYEKHNCGVKGNRDVLLKSFSSSVINIF
jgi:hypothetical protein